MKTTSPILITLAGALLLVAGCGREEESASVDERPSEAAQSAPAPMASDTTQSTDVAGATAESETAEGLEAEMAALEENIAALETKALDKSQQARAELAEELQSLRQEQERLEAKAEALKTAGAAAMQELLGGFNAKLSGIAREIEPEEETE